MFYEGIIQNPFILTFSTSDITLAEAENLILKSASNGDASRATAGE